MILVHKPSSLAFVALALLLRFLTVVLFPEIIKLTEGRRKEPGNSRRHQGSMKSLVFSSARYPTRVAFTVGGSAQRCGSAQAFL